VLSACETGQGFVDNLDGVMGMQLAFKHAGVGSIVMSLWKVPDIATSILMKSFYEELCNGSTIRQSLKRAQKYLIELGYTDPYYWASFVVLD
jgi:CHAT domain-containing protein